MMVHTSFALIASAFLMAGPPVVEHVQATPAVTPVACVNLPADATARLAECAPSLNMPVPRRFAEPPAGGFPPDYVQRRPRILVPMYGALVALQGYDTYSTLAALKKGAVETNPLVSGAASQPAVLVAIKGATTLLTISTAERLWRQDRKGAAIAVMVITNGMLAIVAANNASVLRRQR